MSEKKIHVPAEMLRAFDDALLPLEDGETGWSQVEAESALEAALLWLSENPIVPTPEQVLDMGKSISLKWPEIYCAVWKRRMFLAPEPEVPEEIKDLQGIHLASVRDQDDLNRLVTKLNLEAFRRGRQAR